MSKIINNPHLTLEYSMGEKNYTLTGDLIDVVIENEQEITNVESLYGVLRKDLLVSNNYTVRGMFTQDGGTSFVVQELPPASQPVEHFSEVEKSVSFTIAKDCVTSSVLNQFREFHEIPVVCDQTFYSEDDNYRVTFTWEA